MNEFFRHLSKSVTNTIGAPFSFVVFVLIFMAGISTGQIFHFSSFWQFCMQFSVMTFTFFMALLIQSTENRNSRTIQLKLDELLRVVEGAKNTLVGIENSTEAELKEQIQELQEEVESSLSVSK